MGLMSELGPIDPQLAGIPALALSNALTKIAELVCDHPDSSEMFGTYLGHQLDLRALGYFERISESATQYATRLLEGRQIGGGFTAATLAHHMVNHYKDHSFVIDLDEAKLLLGETIIQEDTPEYAFASAIHGTFNLISRVFRFTRNRKFTFVGGLDNGFKWGVIDVDHDA